MQNRVEHESLPEMVRVFEVENKYINVVYYVGRVNEKNPRISEKPNSGHKNKKW